MMPFERPSLQSIYTRIRTDMESLLTGAAALLRRAVLRVLAKVFAGAIHLCYGFIVWALRQLFVDTAEEDFLARHGDIWNVSRKAAAFATGSVTFTGTDTTVVPIGTRFQNRQGVEFETREGATIAGGISNAVFAQALIPGESGNITGDDLELLSPIIGVDAMQSTGFSGGQDEESDDDYRQRILLRIQNPPMGGNKADYEFWAREVPGVSDAWCFPRAEGDGTVGVVIKAEGVNPTPSDALLTDIYNYIFQKMPIGATLINASTGKVNPIVSIPINMLVNIAPYRVSFADAITNNLEDFFSKNIVPGQPVLISQIRNAIKISGVDDYSILTIQRDGVFVDPNQDIILNGYEYAVLAGLSIA